MTVSIINKPPAGYTNLTQFVDQTAWRVFYSNSLGDVVELALGADGTFLQGNGVSAAPTFAALIAADIPDLSATYQILNANLTSLIGLTFVSTAFVKMTGANTFTLDTATYQPAGTYVTSISIVSANGISGSSSGGTTPALTLALGAITPTTVNGLTLLALATGFSIAGGTISKTLTVDETKSLSNYILADGTRVLTGNWLTSAGATEVQFRATTQRIYSSAASLLDLDANTTLNLRIGTTIVGALTAGLFTLTGTNKIQFTDANAFINASSSGNLVVQGATLTTIGVAGDINLGDGTLRTMAPQTTSKINLGSDSFRYLNLFLNGNIDLNDGANIILDTTTGTKIGTATTQKLAFFNSTPIVQPGNTTDLRTALINLGLYATGGASPLNLNGGALTTAAHSMSGLMTTYNNITTVSNGIPSELATSDLTAQAAAIAATTIYAVPASGLGLYRVSWVATITTVDATSCILGGAAGFQLKYTDGNDSVVKTSNPTTVTVSAVNNTGTSISGAFIAYCKASTNLQYLFGYTAVGGQMRYNLHIKVEAM